MFLGGGSDYTGGSATLNNWDTRSNNQSTYLSSTSTKFGTATSHTFNITGLQLEVGDTATPFEHRSIGEELALCQRYFQKGTFAERWTSTGSNEYHWNFHYFTVVMRASPTKTFSGGVFSNILNSTENATDDLLAGTCMQIAYRANATNTDTYVFLSLIHI